MFLYLLAWLPPSDIHFRNTIQERSLNVEGWGVPLAWPALLRPGSYQAIGLFRISPGPDPGPHSHFLDDMQKTGLREMRARCASVRRRNCIRNRKEEVSGLWRIISRHASHYCLWSGSLAGLLTLSTSEKEPWSQMPEGASWGLGFIHFSAKMKQATEFNTFSKCFFGDTELWIDVKRSISKPRKLLKCTYNHLSRGHLYKYTYYFRKRPFLQILKMEAVFNIY